MNDKIKKLIATRKTILRATLAPTSKGSAALTTIIRRPMSNTCGWRQRASAKETSDYLAFVQKMNSLTDPQARARCYISFSNKQHLPAGTKGEEKTTAQLSAELDQVIAGGDPAARTVWFRANKAAILRAQIRERHPNAILPPIKPPKK